MNPHPPIELVHSERVYQGRYFHLIKDRLRLPSGRPQEIEVLVHPGAVCIAPLTASGELLLVRQYRHAVGEWLLELPAGRLEHGEERALAARRELEEETGFRAHKLELLREFYAAPGFCSEWMSLYLATELEPAGAGARAPDPDEELELVRLTPAQALAQTRDAKTLIACALLLNRALTTQAPHPSRS